MKGGLGGSIREGGSELARTAGRGHLIEAGVFLGGSYEDPSLGIEGTLNWPWGSSMGGGWAEPC